MRVTFNCIDDFIQEMADATVRDKLVRVRVDQEWEQEEQVTCHYSCYFTMITVDSEKNPTLCEYVVQVQEEEDAVAMHVAICDACEEYGLKSRQGRIEMY